MARILIIDDEKLQLMLRTTLLERYGYEVVAVENGEEAVNLFLQQPFDLVITDWQMPNMTGLDIAHMLKKHRPSVPIILLTGWDKLLDDGDERGKEIDLILPKPCDAETLITMVRKSLDKSINKDTSVETDFSLDKSKYLGN